MNVLKYLQNTQPIIYKSFSNAIKNNELSHAYLISGSNSTPQKDVAIYLAQSILCENPSPLACLECLTCLRLQDGNYTDFLLVDGSKDKIKKENILEIERRYSKKGFEGKGIMVYVVHLIENATTEAVNGLLKFLEEPQDNVYAILTCSNLNGVLPTIISRCQILNLRLQPRSDVIKDAIEVGVKEKDAQLLSYFYNDKDLLNEHYKDNDNFYYVCKKHVNTVFETLINGTKNDVIYYFESVVCNAFKTKENLKYFLDTLVAFLEDVLAIQNSKDIYLKSYDKLINGLASKLSNVNEIIIEILKQRNVLNINVNNILLLMHVCFIIVGEKYGE